MFIQGTKWLTPLADLINYAPHNDNRRSWFIVITMRQWVE